MNVSTGKEIFIIYLLVQPSLRPREAHLHIYRHHFRERNRQTWRGQILNQQNNAGSQAQPASLMRSPTVKDLLWGLTICDAVCLGVDSDHAGEKKTLPPLLIFLSFTPTYSLVRTKLHKASQVKD